MKTYILRIEDSLWHRFKIVCAREKKTLKQLLTELIEKRVRNANE